ncbi:MAG: ABC transporter substrate-binding protein [Rhodospirillales bacterium]|nr:ABC transporter substrate-binding protein [Rhodospirillales bacterium]
MIRRMMHKTARRLFGVVLALAPVSAGAADSVSFALDWVVNGTHSGYFTAREKGYYNAAGLDVTISRGFGSGDTIKRVAAGSSLIGLADTGAIIAARANDDIPVRIVAMIYDRATLGLIYLSQSGIKSPKDIEGRAIGRSASGASVNMFPAFLKANAIDRSKIREVVVDGATFLPLLMSGKVDAVLEQSINLGKFQRAAAQQGKTAVGMRYSDFGLEAYGNALFVRTSTAQEKRDVVRRFVEASLKGIAYAFDHPDEAVAILRKHHPEVDAAAAGDELRSLKEMQSTPEIRRNGLGHIDRKRMETTRDNITPALSLKRTVPVEDIYVTGYLPATPVVPAGK